MRRAWLAASLIACHAPRPVAEPCWFDRSVSPTTFEVRPDGDLVVLRGTHLSRVGPTGAVVWEAPIEVPAPIEVIALDPRGDVLVVGTARRPEHAGDAELPSCFVMKRSGADGRALWTTRFTSTGDTLCRVIAADAAGDVYAAGYFAGTLIAPTGTLASAGSNDFVVMRLAGGDGAVRWIRRFGGRNNDIARAIAIDPAGHVIVGGQFSGEGPPADGEVAFGRAVLHAVGDFDAVLLELTADGEPIWARTFGDSGFDLVKSIAPDKGGNLYISGAVMRPQVFRAGEIPFFAGVMDGFVAKYGPTGELAWRHVFTRGAGSQAHHIALDARGRPWIVGHFQDEVDLGGHVLVAPPGHAQYTAYAAGLTPAGDVAWAELFGAPAAQLAYRIAVAPSGALVVGGHAKGPGMFCGKLHDGAPNGDDFIVRFTP